ncbi:MAG: IspD/TarI family cytidylyltransferase [Candidatus Hydrogenedentota bacterium]
MKHGLVIACGGIGSRLYKSIPKQFVLIKNKPLLFWTLKNILKFKFNEIVVTYPRGYKLHTEDICKNFENILLVEGGKRRQDSVRNAVNCLKSSDVLFIHDGVRPFVNKRLINSLLKSIGDNSGIIPVLKIPETVKEICSDRTTKTIDRKNLYLIQTPQVFYLKHYLKVLDKVDFSIEYTDDAQMFEMLGESIATIEGLRYNIKITYDEDIILAEKLLEIFI